MLKVIIIALISMPALLTGVGIDYNFANPMITSDGDGYHFEFDITAAATGDVDPGTTRMVAAYCVLDYNALGFGSWIVNSDNVTVTHGSLFSDPDSYMLIVNDNNAERLSITADYDSGSFVILPVAPALLFHIRILISGPGEYAGIEFSLDDMIGQSFYRLGPGSYSAYAPVQSTGSSLENYLLDIPRITLNTDALDNFGSIVVGQVSTPDTLFVSGSQLTGDILIDAPTGFELSIDPAGGSYTSCIYLTPTAGTVLPTLVYLRFAPSVGGYQSGYLVASSPAINSVQTLVSGIGITTASVTTAAITEITEDSAIGGGSILSDGWSPVVSCGVCWATQPDPTLADDHTIQQVNIGPFISYLTGLSPNTTYYVRAYAANAAGIVYGEGLSFATPLGNLEPPQNLSITIAGSNVELSWSAVINANSYLVYRSTDPLASNWGLPLIRVTETGWTDTGSGAMDASFYRVVASTFNPLPEAELSPDGD